MERRDKLKFASANAFLRRVKESLTIDNDHAIASEGELIEIDTASGGPIFTLNSFMLN